jgi:hypothetical protein
MHLGTWPTVDKACQVRDSFFADMRRQQCKREGPWDHSTGSEPPAAAIIGTPEGWRALDVPEDVLPVAAKAAGKKLKGRIWTTVTAAKAALLQEIAKLPKPTRLLGRKAKTAVSFTSRTRKKSTKGHPKGGSQIKQEK